MENSENISDEGLSKKSEDLIIRGNANSFLGKYAESIKDFDEAIKLNPNHDDARKAKDKFNWKDLQDIKNIVKEEN